MATDDPGFIGYCDGMEWAERLDRREDARRLAMRYSAFMDAAARMPIDQLSRTLATILDPLLEGKAQACRDWWGMVVREDENPLAMDRDYLARFAEGVNHSYHEWNHYRTIRA